MKSLRGALSPLFRSEESVQRVVLENWENLQVSSMVLYSKLYLSKRTLIEVIWSSKFMFPLKGYRYTGGSPFFDQGPPTFFNDKNTYFVSTCLNRDTEYGH